MRLLGRDRFSRRLIPLVVVHPRREELAHLARLTTDGGPGPSQRAAEHPAPAAQLWGRARPRPVPSGSVVIAAVAIIIVAAFNLNIPYFAIRPGPTQNVLKLIEIEGTKTKRVTGELLLTTVSLHEIKVAEAVRGWFDSSYEILSRSAIIPEGESEQEAERRTLAQMEESHRYAAAAALRHLGYDVKITRPPARILDVAADAPARKVLRRGDVIVAVDSVPVNASNEFGSAVQRRKVGEVLALRVKRGSTIVTVKTKTIPRIPGSKEPIVGVLLDETPRIELPVAIDIESLGIGGPSAGLMYALGIVDLLDETDLTNGRTVAGTGEIAVDGKVGAVGAVRQKVLAARGEEAEIFLAPRAELDEACFGADRMTVIGVETLQEAIRALRDARFAKERSC